MKRIFIVISILLFINDIFAQQLPSKGICAHRGVSFSYPENTLASIKHAVELGAQMIEFDVRSTKDNKLIIMHDKTVDRTTNGNGAVKDLTLEEIRKLDSGIWKSSEFQGEKVPTFEEVLNIIPETILMNIHVKHEHETAIVVAKLLTERNQIKNAVMAVDNKDIDTIRAINSNIKICCMERGESPDEYINSAIAVDADFIQLKDRSLPKIKEIVAKLKQHDIMVNYYHAEDYLKMKMLFDAGVDFILINNVEAMMKVAKEKEVIKE